MVKLNKELADVGDTVAIDRDGVYLVGKVTREEDGQLVTTIPEDRETIDRFAASPTKTNDNRGKSFIQKFDNSNYQMYMRVESMKNGSIQVSGL